jgi:hypothetical protein
MAKLREATPRMRLYYHRQTSQFVIADAPETRGQLIITASLIQLPLSPSYEMEQMIIERVRLML